MEWLGRLNTIKLAAFPCVVGWILMATGNSFTMILIGRILTGLSCGNNYSIFDIFLFLILFLNLFPSNWNESSYSLHNRGCPSRFTWIINFNCSNNCIVWHGHRLYKRCLYRLASCRLVKYYLYNCTSCTYANIRPRITSVACI